MGPGSGRPWTVDALAPVVAFERGVEGECSLLNTGERVEALIDSLVEGFKLLGFVASGVGIDVDDDAVLGLDAEVLVFKIVEALGHETRANEEDDGESGLQDDE